MKRINQDRSLLIYLLLSLVTLGIYALYHQYAMIRDINVMLSKDGKRTPQIYWVILFGILTCTIFPLFWHCELGNRLRNALQERDLPVNIGGGGQLVLSFFGRQIIFLSWIAQYKLIHACNRLAAYHNRLAVYHNRLGVYHNRALPQAMHPPRPKMKNKEKNDNDLYW